MNKRTKNIIILIIIYFIVYSVFNTIYYQNTINTNQLNQENKTLLDEIDLLNVEINTKNSRELILQENNDLEIRDNVYYLKDNES